MAKVVKEGVEVVVKEGVKVVVKEGVEVLVKERLCRLLPRLFPCKFDHRSTFLVKIPND